MPNYYAHLTFGQAVRDCLETKAQAAVDSQRQGFDCGLYGPDPLFFYHNGIPSPMEREAHALHHGPPQTALERLRRPIEEGVPFAQGYALGFLCHYLLDRSCHPFVYGNASARGISHMAMEGEFDRFLMQRDGIDPHRITPMERPTDPMVYAAAAHAYRTVDAHSFQVSMAGFYRVSHLLTLFQGTAFCAPFDLITCKSNSAARMLLHKSPAPETERTNPALLALLEGAVRPSAALVEQVFDAYQTSGALDFLPRENFQGRPLAAPAKAGAV